MKILLKHAEERNEEILTFFHVFVLPKKRKTDRLREIPKVNMHFHFFKTKSNFIMEIHQKKREKQKKRESNDFFLASKILSTIRRFAYIYTRRCRRKRLHRVAKAVLIVDHSNMLI